MRPKQGLFNGKITIIRPLAYVEEGLIRQFVKQLDFPHHKCACPNSITSQRTKIENIIKDLEKISPDIKKNIFRSLKRVKHEYLL
jgi:tRNA 2-thiocytidine biosynthesis protein TtcA